MKRILSIIKLCRPAHSIKNVLILLPPFFVHELFDPAFIKLGLPAFVSFSAVASCVYVLNDLFDREKDRAHPTKCKRPIASGEVSVWMALALAALLLGGATVLLSRAMSPGRAAAILGFYFASNIAYSMGLKHVPIVDVMILASGFVSRVFYGGVYFGIPISSWLFLCVFSAAMFFAIGKRRSELSRLGVTSETRPVLKKYNKKFLDMHYYMFSAMCIVFYSLWTILCVGEEFTGRFTLTIPLMIFVVIRYNYILESGKSDGDPLPVLLSDGILIFSVLAFLLANFYCVYCY